MPNRVLENEKGTLSVRLDDAFVAGGKYLTNPYPENGHFFGSFRFVNEKAAEKALKKAANIFRKRGMADTIFEGEYPKFHEDPKYGTQLDVNNKVNFYYTKKSKAHVPDDKIDDYYYTLELYMAPSKNDNGIYVRCQRAIVLREKESPYNDDLYDDLEEEQEDIPDIPSDNEDNFPFD